MDGSHLADLLVTKNYEVFGTVRNSSAAKMLNIKHLLNNSKIHLVKGDLTNRQSLLRCLKAAEPDEVYNLAGQSSVGISWDTPEETSEVTGVGTLRLLEAIREYGKKIRFCQASSSEIFGNTTNFYPWDKMPKKEKSDESTPFDPRSPYGVSKLFAHCLTKNYRQNFGMFNCSAILFNHEGPRRSSIFVTRKISETVAKIALGLAKSISLGDLNARRDWGYAPEYVEAMWLMLQQNKPDDYVIATGISHNIRDFLNCAFKYIGIADWRNYIVVDERYIRLAEPDVLCGDASKAKRLLGWEPKMKFEKMVEEMVQNDLDRLAHVSR